MKYVNDFIKYFSSRKFPVFTKSDAYLFLSRYGVSDEYSKRFLGNLAGSGKAYRIKRNYYTCHASPYVAGFAFAPFYYGLGTALGIHNVTEQQSQPTVISATKSMPRVLMFRGAKVFIRRIRESMLFGMTTVAFEEFEIPISDMEKTLIDLVYFRYGVDDYVYRNLVGGSDAKKLNRYLRMCTARLRKSVKAVVEKHG